MTDRRSYHQHCGLARALDRVGERWTLLIVRNLLLGPKRYSDLQRGLPGITTNLLAKRLREMQVGGVLRRTTLGGPGRAEAYELTELGRALEPAVMELARWGGRFLGGPPSPEDVVDIGWGLLSLKRRYVGGLDAVVELRIDDRVFELVFEPDYLRVTEHPSSCPRAVVTGSLDAFLGLFFGGGDGEALRCQGALQVHGDEKAFELLLRAFGR